MAARQRVEDPWLRLRRLVTQAAEDPVSAPALAREAREVADEMARETPYSGSRLYLPGLSMPCTTIIEVQDIPQVEPGTTSENVQINIRTPGVVVGLLGATLPNADTVEKASLAFQLTVEAKWSFASDGQNTDSAFASYSTFGLITPWTPVMIPCRGSGGWSVRFRNAAGGDPIVPIFNLAFLEGWSALAECGFSTDRP